MISAIRSALYLVARLLGDVQAVRRGRVMERVARRAVGWAAGRAIGRLPVSLALCATAGCRERVRTGLIRGLYRGV